MVDKKKQLEDLRRDIFFKFVDLKTDNKEVISFFKWLDKQLAKIIKSFKSKRSKSNK